MRLHIRACGLAVGIVWGMYVFLATIWLLWFRDGATISALSHLYPGYASTYPGAVAGLAWGLLDGFIVGAALASLYNILHKWFSKTASVR